MHSVLVTVFSTVLPDISTVESPLLAHHFLSLIAPRDKCGTNVRSLSLFLFLIFVVIWFSYSAISLLLQAAVDAFSDRFRDKCESPIKTYQKLTSNSTKFDFPLHSSDLFASQIVSFVFHPGPQARNRASGCPHKQRGPPFNPEPLASFPYEHHQSEAFPLRKKSRSCMQESLSRPRALVECTNAQHSQLLQDLSAECLKRHPWVSAPGQPKISPLYHRTPFEKPGNNLHFRTSA